MKNITFAERLKEARKAAKLSQEALAKKIGRTKSTISRWESGERNPKMFEMIELENILGISAETLMYGTEKINPISPLIEETVEAMKKLEEPRQQIVLDTATSQLKEQKDEESNKNKKIVSIFDKNSPLTDEELQEAVDQAVAFDGKPLTDREKEVYKHLLFEAWEEDHGRG